MWVLKKINQEQELASGKFSSQSKLAEFMGMHSQTLNKALKEGRNSFQFRGETVSVHQLPEFSAHDSSGNQKFFEKEAQIVEFFGVSRQTVYSAFKLNQSEKAFKKDGKVWIVKRILSPENEIPICKDQRSQSLKIPTSTSTSTKKKSVPDQRSHTMKPSYTKQKRLPRKPPPPPAENQEEWEKYLDEANREEEEMRNENIRNFLRSQQPWFILPPTFPMDPDSRIALFHPDTNTSQIVAKYSQAVDYFRDNGLNFYLTQDEFYFKENGCIRPILDFCVDSPEDFNPQYWKRYIFIWPIGVTHYNIDAKPPRKSLLKSPSEAVSEVISESPED